MPKVQELPDLFCSSAVLTPPRLPLYLDRRTLRAKFSRDAMSVDWWS